MMLKPTIVALILGTSSLAMARPATVRGSADVSVSAEASFSVRGGIRQARPPVQNGPRKVKRIAVRAPVSIPAPAPSCHGHAWVDEGPTFTTLATGLQYQGSQYVKDLGFTGDNSWNQIRIEARGSKNLISEVRVTFLSGETQSIMLGKTLEGRDVLTLDLDGRDRQVGRVLVYGKTLDGNRSHGFAVLAF